MTTEEDLDFRPEAMRPPLTLDTAPFAPEEPAKTDPLEQMLRDDTPQGIEPEADPWEIPGLTLPSGARVEFRRMDRLTTENLRWLRKAMDADGAGSFLNDLMDRGAQLLIDGWDATTPDGRPLEIPRKTEGKSMGKLSLADGKAIEKHLTKPLLRLVRDDSGK